VARGSRPANGI